MTSPSPEDPERTLAGFEPRLYEDEARQRWGRTDAWKQSHERAKSHTKEEWKRIQKESGAAEVALAQALKEGADPRSSRAMDLAEEHRLQISRDFYDCSPQMHASLAQMYLQDPRFEAHYEAITPGLARFVSEAIHANTQRHLSTM